MKNIESLHFNALRLVEGMFKSIESIGSEVKTVSDRQMMKEIQRGEATKNGLMPVWKVSRAVPERQLKKLKRKINHNIASDFEDIDVRLQERCNLDYATIRAANLVVEPWRWNTDGGVYERHKGPKWTVLRPTEKGWLTRRVMMYDNGVRLLFSPRNGASIAEASVFSEKGNGTSLLEAPGDAIFRDYILTRSWRQWYGDDVEGMNVWMEPVTKEMNFQYKEYTKDRPIVRL